jgi:hypothetical protein
MDKFMDLTSGANSAGAASGKTATRSSAFRLGAEHFGLAMIISQELHRVCSTVYNEERHKTKMKSRLAGKY